MKVFLQNLTRWPLEQWLAQAERKAVTQLFADFLAKRQVTMTVVITSMYGGHSTANVLLSDGTMFTGLPIEFITHDSPREQKGLSCMYVVQLDFPEYKEDETIIDHDKMEDMIKSAIQSRISNLEKLSPNNPLITPVTVASVQFETDFSLT